MPTIAELKKELKSRGLPISGSKQILLNRLPKKHKQASVKKGKNLIGFNKLNSHPLATFYITTYFQKPNSKMAQEWIKSQGLTHSDAKHFYDKIMKK